MTAAEKQKTDERVLKEKMAEAYRVYQRNIREADHLVYELTKGARGDVPEKELLLILADAALADAVVDAVRALPCFAEKGSGIAFRVPVRDFAALGAAE